MPHLLCFGLGYTAEHLARGLLAAGWRVTGTTRDAKRLHTLQQLGCEAQLFDGSEPLPTGILESATHILSSIPPGSEGDDPVLACHAANLERSVARWLGYLSSTGVYGDRDGATVDETAEILPTSDRAQRRRQAEQGWLDLARNHGRPVQLFRLAGIYGPGRSALEQMESGRAQRIDKPGQLFSRIHVDDIAAVLRASMERPNPGRIYNVADDEPAPSAEVIAYAAALLGVPAPPVIPFEEAQLSPMAAAFYADNRRIDNTRIKTELGITLRYPSYRPGLEAVQEARTARQPPG